MDDARRLADDVQRTPLDRYSSLGQIGAAFEFAQTANLSGYDAFYAVLAEALDLPLVTADRKLAAALDRSVLVTQESAAERRILLACGCTQTTD